MFSANPSRLVERNFNVQHGEECIKRGSRVAHN